MPGASFWPRVTSFCLWSTSTSKKGKGGLGNPHKSEWKQTKMCHQLWRWHRQEQSFITTCLGGPVQLVHSSTWVMRLSCIPDSGKRIIILQCHIFPPSSVGELKSNRKFSSSENHIFVILSLGSCCLHLSSQIRDMLSMGASSGFHLLPYRCKTWGVFTGKLEEWVCGGKDGACEMVS